MSILSERIKLLREELNLTQFQLAEKLGIATSSISQYESGDRIPSDDIKIKLAKFFDVSLDFLMGLSDIRNPYVFFTLSEYFNSLNEEEINEVIKYILFIKKFRDSDK